MHRHNISGIVVVEGAVPVGIVSLRDLRELVAHNLSGIAGLYVKDVMRTNLITIGRHDYLFKAIFRMAKHNIHRLVVLNSDGSLAGVITNTDLLRVQTRCPLFLSQEMKLPKFERSVKRLTDDGYAAIATKSGADTQSLISLIAHFNDAMTLRIIELLDRLKGCGYLKMPLGWRWAVRAGRTDPAN